MVYQSGKAMNINRLGFLCVGFSFITQSCHVMSGNDTIFKLNNQRVPSALQKGGVKLRERALFQERYKGANSDGLGGSHLGAIGEKLNLDENGNLFNGSVYDLLLVLLGGDPAYIRRGSNQISVEANRNRNLTIGFKKSHAHMWPSDWSNQKEVDCYLRVLHTPIEEIVRNIGCGDISRLYWSDHYGQGSMSIEKSRDMRHWPQ
jgi:hypothetical protein